MRERAGGDPCTECGLVLKRNADRAGEGDPPRPERNGAWLSNAGSAPKTPLESGDVTARLAFYERKWQSRPPN